jgi:hypothetical protein
LTRWKMEKPGLSLIVEEPPVIQERYRNLITVPPVCGIWDGFNSGWSRSPASNYGVGDHWMTRVTGGGVCEVAVGAGDRQVVGSRVAEGLGLIVSVGLTVPVAGVVTALELIRFRRGCWGERKQESPKAKNPSTICAGIPAPNHRAGARGA